MTDEEFIDFILNSMREFPDNWDTQLDSENNRYLRHGAKIYLKVSGPYRLCYSNVDILIPKKNHRKLREAAQDLLKEKVVRSIERRDQKLTEESKSIQITPNEALQPPPMSW